MANKRGNLFIDIPELDECAKDIVWLNESGGLAAHPWNKEINDIICWVTKYVKEHHSGKEMVFFAPVELVNKIDFFRDVKIKINAIPLEYNIEPRGRFGYSKPKPLFDIKTNKFINCYILITCQYDKEGNVKWQDLIPNLYHEINHAYHAYVIGIKNNYDVKEYEKSVNKYLQSVCAVYDETSIVRTIIYRLFSETEFNALVCNFYGELKANNVTRFNFRDNLAKMPAYKLYRKMLDEYESAIDNLSDIECNVLYRCFYILDVKLNKRILSKNDVKSFKIAFKKKTKLLLDKLIKKFGKVASLWLDDNKNKF